MERAVPALVAAYVALLRRKKKRARKKKVTLATVDGAKVGDAA